MSKLLKFYLPHCLKGISLFFFMALVVVIGIKLLPMEDSGKDVFSKIIIWIVFPALAFFSRKFYLPAGLGWILLTPVKKKEIVFSHGILNLLKLLLIFLFINLYFLLIHQGDLSEVPLIELIEFLSQPNEPRVYTRMPIQSLLFVIGIVIGVSILLFGILPNYVQQIQDKQNYRIGQQYLKNKKRLIRDLVLAASFPLGLLVLAGSESIPSLVNASLFIAFILFGAIASTFFSLKYYHSKGLLIGSAIGFFLMLSAFSIWYGQEDVKSQKLELEDRIESFAGLGVFQGDGRELLINELLKVGPDSISVNRNDLKPLFASEDSYIRNIYPSRDTLLKLCDERKNHACRLAAYLDGMITGEPHRLEYLHKGCPKDLGSCYAILVHSKATVEQQEDAEFILKRECVTNSKESSGGCRSFEGYQKREKQKRQERIKPVIKPEF